MTTLAPRKLSPPTTWPPRNVDTTVKPVGTGRRRAPAANGAGGGQRAPEEPARLRLRLLEGFALTCDGCDVTLPSGPQRLLAFLALRERPLRRGYVSASLWPDSTEARADASLRSTLWRLRRLDATTVVSANGCLALHPAVAVDVREAVATVRRLRDPGAPCHPPDLDPSALGGELLPDWAVDDWTSVERERLRQVCLHGLEAMCSRLVELGRFGEAVEAGLAAVRAEPLRESAHRAVVLAHLAAGNQAEALRQYHWYVRALRAEPGLSPSAAITGLIAELRPGAVSTAGRAHRRGPAMMRYDGHSQER